MDDHAELGAVLISLGRASGLDAVGIASAAPFAGTLADLSERKAAGLHGEMAFTYRNPSRSTDPTSTVAGARSLVVGARSYRRATPDAPDAPDGRGSPPRGRVARYSWRDHYAPLRAALEAIAERLRAEGWTAAVVADDNALVDREAAFRAGLGWYGKNTMLLLHGHGSEFVLGSVITDAPLPPTNDSGTAMPTPREAADVGCGPCVRCLPACPTGALVEPGILDARRCLAWLVQARGVFPVEHRIALGSRIYGCDDCQDVCPPNRLEIRRRPPPVAEAIDEAEVDLLDLLEEVDDDALLERHGRWYIADRQARHLRRNALLALGNVGDGTDPRVADVLTVCLADPDPLIRGHAVWAAGRLGRHDLLTALAETELDAQVRVELGAVPSARTS